MRLKQWALIAEIASGFAVLVTLIFLVIGIRDNTNATQATVYEDLMNGLNQFNLGFVNDAALTSRWVARYDTALDSMPEEEANQLVILNRVLYRIYEAAFFSFENESLSPVQWERFSSATCRNARGPESQLWVETTDILSAAFAAYIEANCDD